MNAMICKWLHHPLTMKTQESAGGKRFRYVETCRCKKRIQKSIPLHDNDLLENIQISNINYPVDIGWMPQVQS